LSYSPILAIVFFPLILLLKVYLNSAKSMALFLYAENIYGRSDKTYS